MNYEVYGKLQEIRNKHGPQEFGRICQALLELTLRALGFKTRGRSVERPDITAERGSESYAIEVKAPSGATLSVDKEDLGGLTDFEERGITPVLAALALTPAPRWLLLDARRIRPRKYNVTALRLYSIGQLEAEINEQFPSVLGRFFEIAMARKSKGLLEKLSKD